MGNKRGRSRSVIFLVLLFCVSGAFLFTFFKLQIDISEKRNQYNMALREYEEISEENVRVRTYIEEADEAKIVERYARENWGYVFPEERVYYDITPGA